MGVYIPNMEKPKGCGECDLWSNCFYPKNPYTEQDDYIAPDCELIDIVTCGECKWWESAKGGWNGWCRKQIDAYATFYADDFCSYGEREEE